MEQRAPAGRIAILQRGQLAPRYPSEPMVSSACSSWRDIQLERHRLRHQDEGSGTTCGYQICLNAGAPSAVTWKSNGRACTHVVGLKQLSLATHGQVRAVSWTSPMDVILFALSESLMMELSVQEGDGRMLELEERHAFDDPHLATLLHLLQADVVCGTPAGSVYGEQLGTAVAIYLAHRFAIVKPKLKQYRSALPGPTLRRVLELVERKLQTPLALQDLANEAGISCFHFTRLFRNSVGQSPARYLTGRRVERVKQLLASSDRALPEIAVATGFCSQSHMTAVFRKRTGTTPAQFGRLKM